MSAAPTRPLTLGFDADDTLWHNENIFEKVHVRYRDLLARYHDAATVDRTLFATEMRNLERYGYGVKGFTLSSIETAIQLTAGKISAEEINQIITLGQEMLAHPVDLLDGVVETLSSLSGTHRLLVITKGDLRDQERKLARSGLATTFATRRNPLRKRRTFLRRDFSPPRHRSTALPDGRQLSEIRHSARARPRRLGRARALPPDLGGRARRNPPRAAGRFFEIQSVRDLPAVLTTWSAGL
jgi:putative hydrolase of the HAD superfamily